jgi:uncharacterized protein YegP (UPF0339 family)
VKQFLRQAALFAVLAGGSVGALTVATGEATAQKKETPKKDEKSAKHGVVKIGKGKDDKFRFSVYDGDGKFLAMSAPGGYATKAECEKGLEALKDALTDAKIEDKK